MNKRMSFLSAVLALMMATTLAACGSSAGTKEAESSSEEVNISGREWNEGGEITIPEPAPNSGRGVKIAFSSYGQDNPYSQYVFKAVQKEAEKYGATATFVGPPTYEEQGQYETLTAIAQAKSYDAVVLLPINGSQIVPAVEKLLDAGIKVAGNTLPIGADQHTEQIQVPGITTEAVTPVKPNAEVMANGIVEACEGIDPCEVEVIWGNRALAWESAKLPTFDKIVGEHSNVDIVCQSDANFTQDEGRTQAADCLQAHRDLSVLASQADESARGAESSIEAAGRSFGLGNDDIKVIGTYGTRYAINQVRDGKWLQTWYSRPQTLGIVDVDLLLRSMEGKQVPEWIAQESLDGAGGDALDAQTLEEHPEIVGQWEG